MMIDLLMEHPPRSTNGCYTVHVLLHAIICARLPPPPNRSAFVPARLSESRGRPNRRRDRARARSASGADRALEDIGRQGWNRTEVKATDDVSLVAWTSAHDPLPAHKKPAAGKLSGDTLEFDRDRMSQVAGKRQLHGEARADFAASTHRPVRDK